MVVQSGPHSHILPKCSPVKMRVGDGLSSVNFAFAIWFLDALIVKDIEREYGCYSDVWRIYQLANSKVYSDTCDYIRLVARVSISRNYVINNAIDSISCGKVYVIRQVA